MLSVQNDIGRTPPEGRCYNRALTRRVRLHCALRMPPSPTAVGRKFWSIASVARRLYRRHRVNQTNVSRFTRKQASVPTRVTSNSNRSRPESFPPNGQIVLSESPVSIIFQTKHVVRKPDLSPRFLVTDFFFHLQSTI